MTITAGWTPLSGPKVPAEATNPNRMTGALLALPAPPIPSMRDDGFMADECCAPLSGCGTCGDTMAVNVSSGSLLYRYRIPENTIPIQLSYESDQPGETALGSKGWVSNLHRQITVGSVVVTVRCSDGCLVDYNQDPSNTLTFYPSAGMDNLVQKSTTNVYLETLPNGLQYKYDTQGGSTGRLTNIIDPDGRQWTFNYSGTTLSYVQNHNLRRVTLNYLAGGTLVASFQDTAGRLTTLGYDGSGRITSITGPEGCVRSFEYDSTSRISKASDPDNYYTLITYSSAKVQTVRAVDIDNAANDQVSTYTYSSGATKVTNPLGNATTYSFDTTKKVITKIHDPEGEITTFNWDTNVRVTMVTNPRGYSTKYTWEAVTAASADTRKRLRTFDPSSNGYYTTFTFSSGSFQLNEIQNPLGHRTSFTYLNRHLRSLKNAKNEITTWNYSSNVLSSIQDALNNRTTFTFGGNGMVSKVQDAENNIATFLYDTPANVTVMIDALVYRTTSTYDGANRLTSRKDAEGNVTTYAYTGCGLLEKITDPRGNNTTYVYNDRGLRTVVIDPLGYRTTSAYDKARNLTSVTDALGRITTYGYDTIGRRTTMRDALGQWYTYTFDRNGNLTSSKDPSTALTTNQYDNLDRREVTIDALAYRTTITYDRASNRTSIMDPRRNITTWNYDELGADSLKSSCCAIITFIEGMAYDFRGA